jgi:hypothetical protein
MSLAYQFTLEQDDKRREVDIKAKVGHQPHQYKAHKHTCSPCLVVGCSQSTCESAIRRPSVEVVSLHPRVGIVITLRPN